MVQLHLHENNIRVNQLTRAQISLVHILRVSFLRILFEY
jgi:hypothetical protein